MVVAPTGYASISEGAECKRSSPSSRNFTNYTQNNTRKLETRNPKLETISSFNCVEGRLHPNKAKQKVEDFLSFGKNSPLGPKGRFLSGAEKELSARPAGALT